VCVCVCVGVCVFVCVCLCVCVCWCVFGCHAVAMVPLHDNLASSFTDWSVSPNSII